MPAQTAAESGPASVPEVAGSLAATPPSVPLVNSLRRWWPLGLVALSSVVVLVSAGFLLGVSLGALPDWIEAIGTVAALGAAVALLNHERGSWREDKAIRDVIRASDMTVSPNWGPPSAHGGYQLVEAVYLNNSPIMFATHVRLEVRDAKNVLVVEDDNDHSIGPGLSAFFRRRELPAFTDPRWTLSWTDDATGVRWVRTHLNHVHRL